MLRQSLPGVPLVALTATATPRVRDDIVRNLGMAPGTRWVRRVRITCEKPCGKGVHGFAQVPTDACRLIHMYMRTVESV